MSRSLLAFAALVLISCADPPPPATPPAPPPASPPPPTAAAESSRVPKAPIALEEYFKIRRVSGASFSFDERLVAYVSDEGGRLDLWVKPVAGGAGKQLTRSKGRLHSFAFSPKADTLVYETDQGGDELPHLFLTNAAGDAPKDIAASYPAGRRTSFVRWADDGKTFLFTSNLRDEKFMDLYEYDLKTNKSELLWKAQDKLSFSLASPDHKRFIIEETLSDADGNLYSVERKKPGQTLLTKHTGEVSYGARDFSTDGKTLYFVSDEGGEFAHLRTMDLAKKTSRTVFSPGWDVEDASFSRSHKFYWTVTNQDGTPKVAFRDIGAKKEVVLPAPPSGGAWTPVTMSAGDRYVAATLHTDAAPSSVYVIDLKENKSWPIADVLPESLKERAMVSGEIVKVTSFDGKKVPAFLYKPKGDGPFPAVIDVHGGPTSQSRREFNRFRQYLVSKGFVVLVPNVRGSTGYGKTYTKLDNMDLGGGPLDDVVACKKWLVKEAKVDADKVVVLGGSYGGYMALAAATFKPTEFAAIVDYFGVSDLKSLVESFPPYWASFATFIYKKFGDPKNPAHAKYQHDRSPIHFLDKVERPILVVQGDKDPRVKKDQSDRVVDALKKRKVPVEYLVLQNEGHGFTRNESYLAAFRATDRFLDKYLFGEKGIDVFGQ